MAFSKEFIEKTRPIWKPLYITKGVLSYFRYGHIKMCILGDKWSGKSCLYSFLEGTALPGSATPSQNKVKKFTMVASDGIRLKVDEGTDITGSPEKVSSYYKNKVEESDIIVYLINSSKIVASHIEHKENRKLVFSQLYLISMYIRNREKKLREEIASLEAKLEKSSDDKKRLKKIKTTLNGLTLIVVPTWKRRTCSLGVSNQDMKTIIYNELQKSNFLNDAIAQNKNVHILDMYEMVELEQAKVVHCKEELRKLTDEIVKCYTNNIERNRKL